MRSLSGDIPYDDVPMASTSSQTWTVNDVGEVRLVSLEPASSDVPATHSTAENPEAAPPSGTADPIPTISKMIQREPTPILLRGIDHVSNVFHYLISII